MSVLPKKNELGFFEIRLESIGGLGANLAGKMLAEAGVDGLGLNGSNFSSYGSEKKGSPVKSFVRFCDPEVDIRDHSPIEQPHVIGVFHEALYKMVDVVSGLNADGVVLVNTKSNFDTIKQDLKLDYGTLAAVDALKIAYEEKTKVNTAMLGALFRILDFLDAEHMRSVIKRTFEKKYPHLVEPNIRTFNRGYNEVQFKKYDVPEGAVSKEFSRIQPRLGYETQEIGGIISAQANSIQKDLSGSRIGFLPKYDADSCIHCAACDTVCPDYCFVWEQGEDKRGRPQMFLKGIDYQYCKGCLKCVDACPTEALADFEEVKGFAEANKVSHNFPLVQGGAK
ncbi:2-oxoacid:acceptor oxidoreductase family protein [Salipaludibacillus agaradhaerens]|jgi:pyruvate ferredoxin oxidoreductase gamma subunit|uniref:2-oxoacid:acceptor oxidoreductase family protein n=1 Tax=Salipaludibacillus agaradhaerens TaxID=76935 RepID=A0A9Q4B0P7_SALAG|nr:2-oxoacid:acceptor oxidoreductase family protein [Salipaludibacillus agaradhaerens]UJW57985.1 2-oxoacid:acceptor oxidoreductase family protein [Bacillus sp. A116_S68]MCR6096216.1 2-oxoacid:acceptor oxidoreductase family protein [Salipaludibacillus agaradhaerens]MCR6106896.1 2-oxoacid:acceptor oxidoreductase family protein [Salipaludibacillus agaradhaerens]MCR6114225.1 2-oxoacid:acceptor oxidoreductase family protein [Salipaludibacillus agaradhaerens]MCR6118928.1 2-oxoacid:acceptor oxidoredu